MLKYQAIIITLLIEMALATEALDCTLESQSVCALIERRLLKVRILYLAKSTI